METALRITHLLAMALGLGFIVAAMLMARLAAGRAPEVLRPIQLALARWGFLALVVLWLTGAALVAQGPGAAALPGLFWAKMGAVLLLTAAGVAMQIAIRRLDPPALAARAAILRPLMAFSAIAAVILAVLTFG